MGLVRRPSCVDGCHGQTCAPVLGLTRSRASCVCPSHPTHSSSRDPSSDRKLDRAWLHVDSELARNRTGKTVWLTLTIISALASTSSAADLSPAKQRVVAWVDAHADRAQNVSRQIWAHAEPAFQEHKSPLEDISLDSLILDPPGSSAPDLFPIIILAVGVAVISIFLVMRVKKRKVQRRLRR